VIDTNKEGIAIQEARKLNIPVIAILDTNCDPQGITFPVPGNDDAARALQLYCDLMADSVLDGLTEGQAAMGVDIGAAEAPVEPALRTKAAPAAEEAEPAIAPEPELEAAFTAPAKEAPAAASVEAVAEAPGEEAAPAAEAEAPAAKAPKAKPAAKAKTAKAKPAAEPAAEVVEEPAPEAEPVTEG
jgi:small subunit ribosomal protein S2